MSFLQKLFGSKKEQCACQSASKNLSEAPQGSRLKIECLKGEEGVCQRLREMGFCEAATVEKIADSGALICKVCDSKVVISKKLAENIIVKDVCQLPGHQSSWNSILLSQMSLGQRAVIEDFITDTDDCERIEEMGVTPGEEVEVVRYAPMGDPIEIKVRGYLLSMRKAEAEKIKVKLCPPNKSKQ